MGNLADASHKKHQFYKEENARGGTSVAAVQKASFTRWESFGRNTEQMNTPQRYVTHFKVFQVAGRGGDHDANYLPAGRADLKASGCASHMGKTEFIAVNCMMQDFVAPSKKATKLLQLKSGLDFEKAQLVVDDLLEQYRKLAEDYTESYKNRVRLACLFARNGEFMRLALDMHANTMRSLTPTDTRFDRTMLSQSGRSLSKECRCTAFQFRAPAAEVMHGSTNY